MATSVKVGAMRSRLARYAMAAGAVALAWAVREAFSPLWGPTRLPFIFFFPAVALAAWFGRVGPGVLAIILSALTADWFFIEPRHSLVIGAPSEAAAMLSFLVVAAGLAGAIEAMHRANARVVEAREALAREKELLATTLASIGDAVIVADIQGRITSLNAEAERLTGWGNAEAAHQPLPAVFRILNEETRQPAENPVEKVLRLGTVTALANHTVLAAKDGREIPIDDSAAPIRQPGGPLLGVVLVFRDVTEQRQAQKARARLAAIVEYSGDAIFTKNLEGIIQTWNAGAGRLFGYQAGEIIGKSDTALVPPERLAEEKEILERLRQGQPSARIESVRVARDGRRISVSVSVSPLKDGDGQVIGASKVIHDITDLIEAREALIREKELLATTLASIGDAVIVTDAEGRVTFLNDEAQRLTGWESLEAVGQPLPAVFHIVNEFTRQPVENPVEKVLRLGSVVGLANHTVLIARDGRELPIDDSGAPIRQPGGGLFGVVLVFRDFSERRQAEKQLTEQARLLDLSFDAIVVQDTESRITFWSKGAEETYGYPRKAALGQVTHDLLKTEFPEPREAIHEKLRISNRWSGELAHTRSDGARIVTFSRWVLDRDAQGRPAGILETNNDITDGKAAEEALRASEQRLQVALEAGRMGAWEWDIASGKVAWSSSLEEIHGLKPGTFGGTFEDFKREIHPEDIASVLAQVQRALETRRDHHVVYRMIRPDGAVGWLEAFGRFVLDAGGQPQKLAGICMDITERKQGEAALRESEQRLREAQRKLLLHAADLETTVQQRTAKLEETVGELQQLSYAITHDMRAPLRAMATFAELMLERFGASDATGDARDYCRRILTASSRLDKLIQDALNFSRAVPRDLPMEPVVLSRLLREIIETYPNLHPERAEIHIDGEVPTVVGNESLLTQCFSNLLGNAVKFVAPGTRPQVRVWAETADQTARVWIQDNGIGIPTQAQSRLFGMFQKLDSQYEGTGIGLAIVRKVVERMGGRVGAESNPGTGSRFWVELRVAPERV